MVCICLCVSIYIVLLWCSLHLQFVNKPCYVVFYAEDSCVLPTTAVFLSMPPKTAAHCGL